MRRLFQSLFISFLFLIIVSSVPKISAEERNAISLYQCLDFVRCTPKGSNNKECEPKDEEPPRSKVWSHRVQIDLTNYKYPPNAELYVLECLPDNVSGEAKQVCTTGDHTRDREIICGNANNTSPDCDNLQKLTQDIGYSRSITTGGSYYFNGTTYVKPSNLSIRTDATGKPSVSKLEWESHTDGNIEHAFQVRYLTNPPVTPSVSPAAGGVTPGIGGQQQAILTFPAGVQTTAPLGVCHGETYDPFGYVFDTKTLEPIAGVSVLLSMKKSDGTFDSKIPADINNPFRTADNGEYVFFVDDGEYKLTPTKAGYSHPALSTQSQLLPSTSLIYSEFYFNDSPAILEQGTLEHRDIPLVPADGVGKTSELKPLLEEKSVTADSRLKYRGQVTHPFAELIIDTCHNENGTKTCTNKKVYDRTNGGPNKYGNYEIMLDQKTLLPGEFYERSYNKVDLTLLKLTSNPFLKIYQWLISEVQPSMVYADEKTTKATINPIMTYVEGFAYDTQGNLLPNAKVQIFIPQSQVPVYQTTADSKGYYKITSEFLPKIEYAIGYVPVGSTTVTVSKITTSQFLSQNKEFIAAEKINTYLVTTQSTNPRRTVTPTYVPPAKIGAVGSEFKETQPKVTTTPTTTPAPQNGNNNILLIGAILLLLIATVGTLLGVYLYKKKMQEQEPQV